MHQCVGMRIDRSSYRRSQRSRIRSKGPPPLSPRVLAPQAPQKQLEQLPLPAEIAAQPQQQAPTATAEQLADSLPDNNMPDDAHAIHARAEATSGGGQTQAARLQAAFEHGEDGRDGDQQGLQEQRVQQPRPRQRQWRDRKDGAVRHKQQSSWSKRVLTEARANSHYDMLGLLVLVA